MPFRSLLVVSVVVGIANSVAAQPAPTSTTALEKLKAGNARFAADKPSTRDVTADKRKGLANGQKPFAVILTCADSRVAPELVFDAGLGELFVLRVAGNIADPAVVGSIEYAVAVLKAPLIVVLGHESCGAVEAAIAGKPLPGDLGWLIKQIKAGDNLPADADAKLAAGVRNNVRAAAKDLELRSKIIHEEVKEKKVAIVSAVYSLKTGKIEWLASAEKKKVQPEKNRPDAEPIAAPRTEVTRTTELIPPPAVFPGDGATYNKGVVESPPRFPRLRAFLDRRR